MTGRDGAGEAREQRGADEGTLCVLCPREPSISETFIRAHIERLPCRTVPIWGWRPSIGDEPILSRLELAVYKTRRALLGETLERQTTAAFLKAFRRRRAFAALAEYGDHAVHAIAACRAAGIPLIAHFHGYDASRHDVLTANAAAYSLLFRDAAAIVAVSRAMQRRLVDLGAPPRLVHYNPYGVDCGQFHGAAPAAAPPVLIAVGRFTDKKAPQLTLAAFAKAHGRCPDSRLRMIGDGPLRGACEALAHELGIAGAVAFLGAQASAVVREEMRRARAFVQHSLEPPSGDCEGTPVAVIEAGATGLPVIATRHGGIPDVVVEGETGLLVDERDVDGMARHMVALLSDPELAARLGRAGRVRVEERFSIADRLAELFTIIRRCAAAPGKPAGA